MKIFATPRVEINGEAIRIPGDSKFVGATPECAAKKFFEWFTRFHSEDDPASGDVFEVELVAEDGLRSVCEVEVGEKTVPYVAATRLVSQDYPDGYPKQYGEMPDSVAPSEGEG